jgi:uncharacterized RDD family membrane protein YckC
MTTEQGQGDERRPARAPGEAPLALRPLPPAGAPPTNGASGAPDHRRVDHAARAARAQAAAALRARADGPARAPARGDAERAGAYAGLMTRTIAYALDGALINVAALLAGIAAALALSILHLPSRLDGVVAAVLAVAYAVWVVGYFVTFWSTTGQTPGSRLMRIRVIDAHGAPRLKPRRAAVRVAGLVLATIPLFAGFFMMLWDRRRRCLQDRLARTVVVHAPPQVRIVRRRIAPDRHPHVG